MDKKTNTTAAKPAETDEKSKKVRRAPKKKVCLFCTEKNAVIDYKDVNRLKKFITEKGKIIPRRASGVCAERFVCRHQESKIYGSSSLCWRIMPDYTISL